MKRILLCFCLLFSYSFALNIYQDFSLNTGSIVSRDVTKYARDVQSAAIAYWNGALSRVYPVTEKIRLKNANSFALKWLCDDEIPATKLPSYLAYGGKGAYTGYDHVHFWVWKTLEQGVKAQTKICYNSEEYNRQPLITLTYLNPEEKWSYDSDIQRETDIYLFMHELAHALGFNYDDMPSWLKTESSKYGSGAFTSILNAGGENYVYLQTPQVKEWMRTYHNCAGGWGLVMENHNSRGAASDISAAFYPFELMSGSGRWGQRVSNITLKAFADMGWYRVDFSYAEPSYFGYGSGCTWFGLEQQNNNNWPKAFCNVKGREECDFYGRYNGACQTYKKSHKAMARLQTSASEDCWDSSRPQRFFNNATLGSGCFMGKLHNRGAAFANRRNYCFQFQCQNNILTLNIRGQTYNCTSASTTLNIPNYGQIECPNPTQYCLVNTPYCPRNCHGRGSCNRSTGRCTCYRGFQGMDCSRRNPLAD